jgi:transcriptional regulator with XRE-family HTH domain
VPGGSLTVGAEKLGEPEAVTRRGPGWEVTVDQSYNVEVGQRLRSIRKQKGYSLQEVEERSGQEFKASVVGAYERGERSLSLPRMQRLALFYGVPVDQLLPAPDRSPGTDHIAWSSGGLTIDLNALEAAEGDDIALVERFIGAIQLMRQDFNGKVLTIRSSDLQLLARMIGDRSNIAEVLAPLART